MHRSGTVVELNGIRSVEGGEGPLLKDGRPEFPVTANLTRFSGANWREIALLALGLAIVALVFLFLADGGVLFTRPLWTDELHTVLLASRSTPFAVIDDLAHGADYGPPLLHLATWLIRVVTGPLTNTGLRVASLLSVTGALLLVYATLRRRYSRLPSVAAVAAIASHNLVVAHSFEARFYGPWLLCAAYVAWALGASESKRRNLHLAIASVLLATVHWYGVVSLGIMCAAVTLASGRNWLKTLRSLVPVATGLLAFALCLPLAVGQRHALTVNTWVPEFRFSQMDAFVRIYWAAPVVVVALAIFGIATVVRARASSVELQRIGDVAENSSVVALFSLAIMPLALAAMSVLGQPSMWPRYAMPAVLAWAPVVVLALTLSGPRIASLFGLFVIATWFTNFSREAQYKGAFNVGVARQLAAIQQARGLGVPIVFQSMHAMYATAAGDWDQRLSTLFLELPDSTMDRAFPRGGRFESLNKNLRVERDVARVHSRRFGFPRLAPLLALDSLPRFVIIASDDNLPPGYSGAEGIVASLFPRYRMARLASGMLLLDRTGAAGR